MSDFFQIVTTIRNMRGIGSALAEYYTVKVAIGNKGREISSHQWLRISSVCKVKERSWSYRHARGEYDRYTGYALYCPA